MRIKNFHIYMGMLLYIIFGIYISPGVGTFVLGTEEIVEEETSALEETTEEETTTEETTEEEETTTEEETTEEETTLSYWDMVTPYDNIVIPYDEQIIFIDLCEQYDFSYELLLAWIYTESRWNNSSVSPSGAIGYLQIMPIYWLESAKNMGYDIYDPIGNVSFALYLLNEYMVKSNGDLTLALNAYNGNEWYADLVYQNYIYLLDNFF